MVKYSHAVKNPNPDKPAKGSLRFICNLLARRLSDGVLVHGFCTT